MSRLFLALDQGLPTHVNTTELENSLHSQLHSGHLTFFAVTIIWSTGSCQFNGQGKITLKWNVRKCTWSCLKIALKQFSCFQKLCVHCIPWNSWGRHVHRLSPSLMRSRWWQCKVLTDHFIGCCAIKSNLLWEVLYNLRIARLDIVFVQLNECAC